jgi:hypothetical protein
MRFSGRSVTVGAVASVLLMAVPLPVPAIEAFDGRFQAHGFVQAELRGLSTNFDPDTWYPSQMALTANLELELALLRGGFGPVDSIDAYVRAQVRFDCVWYQGCGLFDSGRRFGDDADYAPSSRLTDGRRRTKNGVLPAGPPTRVHDGKRLIPFFSTPPFDPLLAFSPEGGNLAATLAPIEVIPLAAFNRISGGFDESGFILAPWNRRAEITSLGSLRTVPSSLVPDLPLRPLVPDYPTLGTDLTDAGGLWVPNAWLRRKIDDIDDTGESFNLRERELRWNRGASQQRGEYELKEAYLELELFDARLFARLGKQLIVWGKTELFRSQDQFNPQDVGLNSLPPLEDSRIPLWAARLIYSFYDVGPLQDVRLELAAILDEFQPLDAGTCGEPYSVFLVCAASNGFFAHGYTGLGIAGAVLPPDPWDDIRGLEVGARLEWRWRRFSFSLTDFYGYDDIPTVNRFHSYERKVDVETGRPLDVFGRDFDFSDPGKLREQALNFSPLNRQLFEFACSVSVGVAGQFVAELADDCVGSLFNNSTPLEAAMGVSVGVTDVFGMVLEGGIAGAFFLNQIAELGLTEFEEFQNLLVRLNLDPHDGTQPDSTLFCNSFAGGSCLSNRLTDMQEALLGCGPFYGTICDRDGIDIFHAEASVLFQAFPQFEPGGPVATRYERGKLFILPGARGPGDPRYDPRFDGCVNAKAHRDCAGAMELLNPATGMPFRSEMEALSFNLLRLLAAFGTRDDPECRLEEPYSCAFVRAIFDLTGVGRPDLRAAGNERFGRRDFLWSRGGPLLLQFDKRNVLGFSADFAEDHTKTNWGLEFTWFRGATVPDDQEETLFRKQDVYNLSISVDRPTFVNFLNANRTILFNAQVFMQYIGGGRTVRDRDPFQVLGTFTINTGYFQDRLLSQLTFVHDLRSESGGVIFDLTWRFTSNFSVAVGMATFYGSPQRADDPTLYPTSITNNGPPYSHNSRYDGLSLLRDRDEASIRIRYTF